MADDEPMGTDPKPVPPKSLDLPVTQKKSVKIKKTRTKRGYGQKNKRKNKTKMVNLSILGSNAAGLKSKLESFYNTLNKFRPSICTIQETKNNKIGLIKLPGYQVFEKIRQNRGGGGLLTCVDVDLNPVLVSSCKDGAEILTVEISIENKKIRIINGYGPQEDDEI